jgi:hypothetical protein
MTTGAIVPEAGTESDEAEAEAGGLDEKVPLRNETRLRAKHSGYEVGISGTSKEESVELSPLAPELDGAILTRLVKTSGAEIGPGGPVYCFGFPDMTAQTLTTHNELRE